MKKILMSAPMVRAIGNTRIGAAEPIDPSQPFKGVTRRLGQIPRYKEGEILYVGETWGSKEADHPNCPNGRKPKPGDTLLFRADPEAEYQWGAGKSSQSGFVWRSSMFMPEWAARYFIRIDGARVERLREITKGDAVLEGCDPKEIEGSRYGATMVDLYAYLWDEINGAGSWALNPDVVRYAFTRVERPL